MRKKFAVLLALCIAAGTVAEPAGMLQAKAAELSEIGTDGTGQGTDSGFGYKEQAEGTIENGGDTGSRSSGTSYSKAEGTIESSGYTGSRTAVASPSEPTVKAEQTITAENVEKTVGDEPFLLGAETDGDGVLSYESKNPEIVKVDESGIVTVVAAGTTQIVVTASETEQYKKARKAVTIAVIPEGYTAIHDIADLYAIRNNRSGKYILMNDIDMSSTAQGGAYDCGTGWDSIEEFSGILDGNGYRIVGMEIFGEPAVTRVGLFESISRAEIKNLGIVDCNINITVKTSAYVGAICGYDYRNNINNCYANGKIIVSGKNTDNCYIGGLIGIEAYYGRWAIENCYNDCEIDGSSLESASGYEPYIGGILGNANYSDIGMKKCHNTGVVKGSAQSKVGAICGELDRGEFSNLNYLRGTADRGIGNYTDNANCVSLTEPQMKDQRSFTGFDFTSTWEVDPYCESYPYPQLKNNRMVRVKSIELSPAPTKLIYNQGETLKTTGAALKITYEDKNNIAEDGISTTIPLTADMLSGYDMSVIGKQEVLVSYGNAETSFEIEVKEIPVSSIKVSPAQLSLYRAKEHQLSAEIVPANATDKSVTWESDNPSIASVSASGLVKAKAKGTATVTATSSNGFQSSCIVTVLVPAVSVQLSQNSITLKEGGRATLSAQISPLDSTDTIQWKSANSGIAEVFGGTVVAKSEGTTTVTAYTESGVTAGCTVTVQKAAAQNPGGGSQNSGGNGQNSGGSGQDSSGNQKPAAGKLAQKLSYTKTYTKAYGNKPFQLNARVTKGNGSLTYTSSNKNVIAVAGNGKATIRGTGIAVITVKARATTKYKEAKCKITVKVTPAKQKVKFGKMQKGRKLKVTWKKDTKASGYQIQYGTDKRFKKSTKSITVAKNRSSSKTISKLKSGKRYYVRVRSYKTAKLNGRAQKLYGAWSSIQRSGKVKK